MKQICISCRELKEIRAKGMCKKCYYKTYYEANSSSLAAHRESHRDEINGRAKAYREANRHLLNEKSKAYRESNKPSRAAYDKTYYAAHKKERNAYSRAYYEANKESYAAQGKEYRESHIDACKAHAAAWYTANREHVLEMGMRKRRAAGSLPRSEICGANSPTWCGGVSFGKYCEKWTKKLRCSIREEYDQCDYISGMHMDMCNAGKGLDVHHVDYDKGQGCNGKRWALVPLSMRNHSRTNFNRPFWNNLFIYALAYEEEYYTTQYILEDMWGVVI